MTVQLPIGPVTAHGAITVTSSNPDYRHALRLMIENMLDRSGLVQHTIAHSAGNETVLLVFQPAVR